MCRREGVVYSLQCLSCLSQGVDSQYKGESSRSGRQRMAEHQRQPLRVGSTTNPLVIHSLEVHGGEKPDFLAAITRVEPRALYRVCREAVLISNQSSGPRCLNKCSEWGSPRVPVLSSRGGDQEDESLETGLGPQESQDPIPGLAWSKSMS